MLHSCAIFNNNTNYNYNSIFTLTPLHPFTIIAPLTTPPLGSYGGQVLSHSAGNTSHLAIALPVGRHRQVSIVNQVSTSLGSPRPVSETKGCLLLSSISSQGRRNNNTSLFLRPVLASGPHLRHRRRSIVQRITCYTLISRGPSIGHPCHHPLHIINHQSNYIICA